MSDRTQLLTPAQVARRAGWCCEAAKRQAVYRACRCKACTAGAKRMKRELLCLDREAHGMLLSKRGQGSRMRYLVTLAAIEAVRPQWVVEVATVGSRLEKLEERVAELEYMLQRAFAKLGEVRRKLEAA